MIRRTTLTALTLISLLATSASAEDRGWSLRALGAWVSPDVALTLPNDDGTETRVSSGDSFGFGLGLEYRIKRRVGVRLSWLSADPDVEVRADFPPLGLELSDHDSVSFRPLTLALDIHLSPDSPVDVYLAPMIAYVSYGGFAIGGDLGGVVVETERFRIDDDFAFGAELGFEVDLGQGPWSMTAAVQYLDTVASVVDAEGDSSDIDFDPITITAGVSYRF